MGFLSIMVVYCHLFCNTNFACFVQYSSSVLAFEGGVGITQILSQSQI